MKSLLAALVLVMSATSFAGPINNPPALYEGAITKDSSNLSKSCFLTIKKLKKEQLEIKVNAFGVLSQRLVVPAGTIALTLNTVTEKAPFYPMVVSVKLVDSKPVNFNATIDINGELDLLSCQF